MAWLNKNFFFLTVLWFIFIGEKKVSHKKTNQKVRAHLRRFFFGRGAAPLWSPRAPPRPFPRPPAPPPGARPPALRRAAYDHPPHRQRRRAARRGGRSLDAGRAAARSPGLDRHEDRLRPRRVRRLHGAAGRQAGVLVQQPGRVDGRPVDRNRRGARAQRSARPAAAGVRRARRAAVRLLHVGPVDGPRRRCSRANPHPTPTRRAPR